MENPVTSHTLTWQRTESLRGRSCGFMWTQSASRHGKNGRTRQTRRGPALTSGNASMCGYFVKGGTSYPLSASPAFMIERPELPGLDTILWINVVCPNESEFHWAVEEAKKTAELKAKNLAPSELSAASRCLYWTLLNGA